MDFPLSTCKTNLSEVVQILERGGNVGTRASGHRETMSSRLCMNLHDPGRKAMTPCLKFKEFLPSPLNLAKNRTTEISTAQKPVEPGPEHATTRHHIEPDVSQHEGVDLPLGLQLPI